MNHQHSLYIAYGCLYAVMALVNFSGGQFMKFLLITTLINYFGGFTSAIIPSCTFVFVLLSLKIIVFNNLSAILMC